MIVVFVTFPKPAGDSDTVDCNFMKIFATPGGKILHVITADSMTPEL
jgi:hypothetical protein